MFFYFLGIVLALVTIFGLVHSPAASEHLQLQNFCVWSSSTVRRRLREYNLFGIQDNDADGSEIVDVVEITVTQLEAPSSESPQTVTIEEIDGIRPNEAIEKIEDVKPEEGAAVSRTNSEANEAPSSSTPATESRDSVLSAINASLRRLSSAANSGRINGPQLYQILLRETLLHEKTAAKADDAAAEMSSTHSGSTVTLGAISEDEANDGRDKVEEEPKAKLYFGDAAVEYVPHQQ